MAATNNPMKLAAFFMSAVLVGQVPTSLNFGSPAVSAPIPSATAVGATGFTNTFYWVVARTPGGYSSPGAAIATNTVGSANFSVSNYVVISWPAISGATGYDVIRSDSPSYPASTSCASCAVALNQAGTSFSDQGGATSAYSGGAQSVATQAIFTLDNVTVATPQINVQILNSRQNITFSLPSTGLGTVTSVGLSLPGIFTVSGSPVTTTGTLTGTLATQTANTIWAGPTTGAAAAPTFRALVAADLPSGTIVGTLTANQIAYGSASNTITGSAGLTFSDASNIRLATLAGGSSQSTNPLLDITNSAGSSHWLTVLGDGKVGIGTNAPSVALHVAGEALIGSLRINGSGTSNLSQSGGAVYLDTSGSFAGGWHIRNSSFATLLRILNSGSVGIGTSNTAPVGTLHVYDATASTGATTLTVKAGAGQSTTNLQEWQNSSGTVLASVNSSGIVFGSTIGSIGGDFYVPGSSYLRATANGRWLMMNSSGTDFDRLQFGGTTSSFPSIKRSTTGLIARLADDSADTWVKTLYVQTNVVAVASLPACNPGLEGSHYGVNDALAPTALATVVGGGAVHVSVYCDGTNWIVN
mgnify:CR=1 FL=1